MTKKRVFDSQSFEEIGGYDGVMQDEKNQRKRIEKEIQDKLKELSEEFQQKYCKSLAKEQLLIEEKKKYESRFNTGWRKSIYTKHIIDGNDYLPEYQYDKENGYHVFTYQYEETFYKAVMLDWRYYQFLVSFKPKVKEKEKISEEILKKVFLDFNDVIQEKESEFIRKVNDREKLELSWGAATHLAWLFNNLFSTLPRKKDFLISVFGKDGSCGSDKSKLYKRAKQFYDRNK